MAAAAEGAAERTGEEEGLGEEAAMAAVVPKRSERNFMDPCWKFPYEEVGELFAQASVTEAMLVALEHMQVNWVTVGKSRLDKFFKNVISFPQESASFLARMGALSSFRKGDRVNSNRGPGEDVERPVVWAVSATRAQRRGWGEDLQGRVVFPATVEEVYLDGRVRLSYDVAPDSEGTAPVAVESGVELVAGAFGAAGADAMASEVFEGEFGYLFAAEHRAWEGIGGLGGALGIRVSIDRGVDALGELWAGWGAAADA